jgi:type IV secretory pathway VirB4 component
MIQKRLGGNPRPIVIDEAWILFENMHFSAKIK